MKTKFLLFSLLFTNLTIVAQVSGGQIDDFENGTTQDWVDGGASTNPPVNISSGGPNGVNDNYLSDVSSGGNGPGSKMVMFNDSQWTGNYTSNSIVAIRFNVRVLTNDLDLRIAFDGGGGRICTTNAVTVSAGGAWTQVEIPIASTDFTTVGGSNIATTLSDVTDMRILSHSNPSWTGESIAATLEIDNIEAATSLSVGDSKLIDFSVAPNPGSQFIALEIPQNISQGNVLIHDVLGKQIFHDSFNQSNDLRIDISNFTNGLYLISVQTNEGKLTKRFIKN